LSDDAPCLGRTFRLGVDLVQGTNARSHDYT